MVRTARASLPAMDEMRLIDVAYYLGVSKQRVSQLASEQGFPQPRHLLDGTRVWRVDVVMRWAERSWWGSKPWRERQAADVI
jgi:predicted DNA-binding transcriptional regulator AlpA